MKDEILEIFNTSKLTGKNCSCRSYYETGCIFEKMEKFKETKIYKYFLKTGYFLDKIHP